jgi:hypothetical protein
MLGMLGDPLLTPALDASEVGLGEVDSHAGRLSVDISEVAVPGRRRANGARTEASRTFPPITRQDQQRRDDVDRLGSSGAARQALQGVQPGQPHQAWSELSSIHYRR